MKTLKFTSTHDLIILEKEERYDYKRIMIALDSNNDRVIKHSIIAVRVSEISETEAREINIKIVTKNKVLQCPDLRSNVKFLLWNISQALKPAGLQLREGKRPNPYDYQGLPDGGGKFSIADDDWNATIPLENIIIVQA